MSQYHHPKQQIYEKVVRNSLNIPVLTLSSLLLFCLLNLQDLLHNLLLFHQKGTDDSVKKVMISRSTLPNAKFIEEKVEIWAFNNDKPFPDSSSRQYSTISTVHSPPVSGQSGPLIFSRSQMRNLRT